MYDYCFSPCVFVIVPTSDQHLGKLRIQIPFSLALNYILYSSKGEQSAVNRLVVGSNPTREEQNPYENRRDQVFIRDSGSKINYWNCTRNYRNALENV